MTHLLEKKLFDATRCYEVWMSFCNEFDMNKTTKELHKVLLEFGNQKDPSVNAQQNKQVNILHFYLLFQI